MLLTAISKRHEYGDRGHGLIDIVFFFFFFLFLPPLRTPWERGGVNDKIFFLRPGDGTQHYNIDVCIPLARRRARGVSEIKKHVVSHRLFRNSGVSCVNT